MLNSFGPRLASAALCTLFLAHCGSGDPAPTGAAAPPAGESAPAPSSSPAPPTPSPSDAGATPVASPDASPDAGLPPMELPTFIVGYNEAWFGKNYGSDLTTNYDSAYVAKTLDGIKQAGGHIVRLWLFEGRQGIKLGQGAPQISSVDPQMLKNLGEVLDAARARGIWVYLTAFDGNEMPSDDGPQRDFYWNLLNDKYGENWAFQTWVLDPLLTMLASKEDVIYGFDLVNEIEAPRSRFYWTDPLAGPRDFIRRNVTFIKSKAPWLRVTSTAGWGTASTDIASGFFSGLGLDFYDLHVYSDDGSVFIGSQVCAQVQADGVPILLGEFGQQTQVNDDALQSNATNAFLSYATSSCYDGALAWRFDPAEQWWDFVRDDGSFRPAVNVMKQYAGP
jgi:hypothetical protein